MREIGSEFWQTDVANYDNNLEFLNIGKDYKLLMSGSTAIDYVLNDFEDKTKIVYMPNYCCESMIKPFIDNNYKIICYEVDIINNKYDINIDENCSVFYAMTYFGYDCSNMDNFIKKFQKKGIFVIEDITHRLFCKKNHCKNSTYLIASLRKWLPIYTGGVAIKMDSLFNALTSNYTLDIRLIELKKEAMELKKRYIDHEINDKQKFLELFREANELIENYKNKLMDNESIGIVKSIDINKMIDRRIRNAKLIENKLINKGIKLIYKLNEEDCPLFVPVVLNDRNTVRNLLIKNDIYCPVHWPNFNSFNNEIYNTELSLICDQRYTQQDIEKYIDKLIDIVGDLNAF